jgi:dipeptidyl aminopeptidase/acylaminoacyl peptidase
VDFQVGNTLYRYDVARGSVAALATSVVRSPSAETEAGAWLRDQQRELFLHVRAREEAQERVAAATQAARAGGPQAIPVAAGVQVDQLRMSPDGRWITFRARTPDPRRAETAFMDYVDASGYAEVGRARGKVGEPRDVFALGVVAVDPGVPTDSIEVRWIELPDSREQGTVPHGPLWSLEGTRAVLQFIGEGHEDVWIAEVDLESASVEVLVHDHDDAWIGGPPIQANYLQPALMEWLPGGGLVFASERTGWSHLYLLHADGSVEALTEGAWEVRDARLSPDRGTWLLQAGREHPAEDHLYLMPARGGAMERLTHRPGRHEGWWSPDGGRIAVLRSESVQLPDLYLRDAHPGGEAVRVTVSGADAFYEHALVPPEIVTFRHPDGGPLWAALFRPETPNPEGAALLHIHGGGYRQFAHRGYSVYGWALHLGFINYMVSQGYTVLDFDYRGSAGFGRDYRTGIADAMGIEDTDGAVAAARWLAENADVDPRRIGIYGVSYGGFLTLTSLFRYPGVFAAGVARAAVTDWAHYSDGWTSRILGVPHENPEAYRVSSPIYHAEGLRDPLLLTHGLVDDNVHFQDAARLVQRLIELEKDFEVMYYPVEPHTVQTEASRYDLVRRQAAFFDEHLRGR